MGLKRKPPPGNTRRVRSNGQNLCGVIVNKAGRTVQFESFAERSLLLRLERDTTVRDYLSQPDPISYFDPSGQQHTYTPDFKVWNTDESIHLHEVTLTSRPLEQRHAAAAAYCEKKGWKYALHTEETLPRGSELANLLALWVYRPTRYDDANIRHELLQQVESAEQALYPLVMNLSQQYGFPVNRIACVLYHLLWHGQIDMDWHSLLFQNAVPNPQTRLWFPQKR